MLCSDDLTAVLRFFLGISGVLDEGDFVHSYSYEWAKGGKRRAVDSLQTCGLCTLIGCPNDPFFTRRCLSVCVKYCRTLQSLESDMLAVKLAAQPSSHCSRAFSTVLAVQHENPLVRNEFIVLPSHSTYFISRAFPVAPAQLPKFPAGAGPSRNDPYRT